MTGDDGEQYEEILVESSEDELETRSEHPSDEEWNEMAEKLRARMPWGKTRKVEGAIAKSRARPPAPAALSASSASSGIDLGKVVWVPVLVPTAKTKATNPKQVKAVIKPTKAPPRQQVNLQRWAV